MARPTHGSAILNGHRYAYSIDADGECDAYIDDYDDGALADDAADRECGW